MPERTRPIRKEICLNETEWNIILQKMQQLRTRNFGAYARKMLIDGYIIQVDYTEQKKLQQSAESLRTSITSADASIRPGIFMKTMRLS